MLGAGHWPCADPVAIIGARGLEEGKAPGEIYGPEEVKRILEGGAAGAIAGGPFGAVAAMPGGAQPEKAPAKAPAATAQRDAAVSTVTPQEPPEAPETPPAAPAPAEDEDEPEYVLTPGGAVDPDNGIALTRSPPSPAPVS